MPKKYFLSATACAGILRRSKQSGKALPEIVRRALESVLAKEQSSAKTIEKTDE